MKQYLSLLLVLLLVLCALPATAETLSPAGGWNTDVTEDDRAAAASVLYALLPEDVTLTADYLLAAQVVSGTNYAILCSDDTCWKLVCLYVPLQGDPVLVREEILVAVPDRPLCGNMGPIFGDLPSEQDEDAIRRAFEDLPDATVDQYFVLGQQIVAGSNYLVLGQMTADADTTISYWALCKVYVDLDGNAVVDSVAPIDLSLEE